MNHAELINERSPNIYMRVFLAFKHKSWFYPYLVIVVCIAINAFIAICISIDNPDYYFNTSFQYKGARNYLLTGHNLLLLNEFSRCSEPPYYPDLVRLPLYPIFSASLTMLGNIWLLILAQVLTQIFCCLLLYFISRDLFGDFPALIASLFYATDFSITISNYSVSSEPLSILFLLCSLRLIVPMLKLEHVSIRHMVIASSSSALFMGMAAMTRPTFLYLCLIIPVCIPFLFKLSSVKTRIFGGLVYLLIALTPVSLWIIRNHAVANVARFTTVDTHNIVYYVGGGAYQIRHNVDFHTAREMISTEFNLPTYAVAHNQPWKAEGGISGCEKKLRDNMTAVLMKYPKELAIAQAIGFTVTLISHSTNKYATITSRIWIPPGIVGMLQLRKTSWNKLLENSPFLIAVLSWNVIHVITLLASSSLGFTVPFINHKDKRKTVVFLGIITGYLLCTIFAAGLNGYWRFRLPAMPLLSLFGGYGFVWFCSKCKCRKSISSKRANSN